MKKLSTLLLLTSSLFLMCSCFNKQNNNQSSSNNSSSQPDSSSSSSEDDNPNQYEKDEEGFYILEDDYFSYNEDTSDTKTRNQVYIPKEESSVEKYTQLRMYIGDKQVPLYAVKTNLSHTWTPNALSRMTNSYTTIGLEGKVIVKLQANFNFLNDVTIRPLNRNVPYHLDSDRRVLEFTISDIGQYVIELRSGRTLHLFVEDLSIMNHTQDGVMYFGPGIHKKGNDNRINSSNTINLSSNTQVYIAPGAFIHGKFLANNASNITITGPGYIDGSMFERNADNGTVLVPIEFNWCSNITLKDFACVDPAGWCFNMYFCNGVTIDNTKVISSRSNGDGISLQSCQNVEVTNCFVRSWDDSLVVKNYPNWNNRSIEGTTRSIRFSDCVLWTDLAQSMEVGYECVGEVMEDITFENIVVCHNFHKPVFSIHNGNNANIKNVTFKDITIEGADMGKGDGSPHLIDFRNLYSTNWSSQHKTTSLGSVNGVTLTNVKVIEGINNPEIIIQGCIDPRDGFSKDPHIVSNVTINDLYLYDHVLDSTYSGIKTNSYTSGISFTNSGKTVTGSNYIPKDVSSYGNNITFII